VQPFRLPAFRRLAQPKAIINFIAAVKAAS
jgi:hypothetical protein